MERRGDRHAGSGGRESRRAFALGACAAVVVAGATVALTRVQPLVALSAAGGGGLLATACVLSQRRERRLLAAQRARWDGALPPGYRVAHEVELPGLTADHVVVGPTGVWVVVSPAVKGVVEPALDHLMLDGRRLVRDPRRVAHAAAAVVRDLLQRDLGVRLPVEPVVCFPHATVLGRGRGGIAPVVGWSGLVHLLRRGPTRLSPAARARIRRVLVPAAARSPDPRIRLVGGTAVGGTR